MRLLLFIFLTVCIVKLQGQDTLYLKSYSDTISISRNEATFFKVIYKKFDPIKVDFFNINGTIISTEHFSSGELTLREGEYISYNDKGKIYVKGGFVHNKMNGPWITYSNDGKHIEKEDNYKNSIKDGKSITFFVNGKPKKIIVYLDDKIVKSICFDTSSHQLDCDSLYLSAFTIDSSGMIYDRTEISPQFPGGAMQLMKFLTMNIRYPEEARKKGLEGKVIVKLIINEKGYVIDPVIIKDGVGGGCAEESIRVCNNMPKWTPGIQNGKFVKTYYTLPISYKLQ